MEKEQKSQWRVVLGASFVIATILICLTNAFPQANPSLESKTVSISMRDAAFGSIISYLSNKYDLSFGVELSPGDGDSLDFQIPIYRKSGELFDPEMVKTTFTVELKDARLSEALDAITDQMPDYKWAISDDAINIFPSKRRDDRISRLMDLNIETFVMEKERVLVVAKILNSVVHLPEVKQFAKENNVRIPETHRGSERDLFAPMDEIRLSKLTLKQLLNKAALTKKSSWRVVIMSSKGDGPDTIWIEI